MSELFADTSGWGHLMDPTQVFHNQAVSIYRTARLQRQKVVTTNYVLVELVALLTRPLRVPRSTVIAFIEGLKSSPHVEVVHVDTGIDAEAWKLLRNRPDKEWSLVDCASFTLMSRRGIRESLTSDQDFEQAGFVRLLK
jgi:predicted nucleic acid-binding protein